MDRFDLARVDSVKIEEEARRLRAEATRAGVRRFRGWVSQRFASTPRTRG